MVILISVIYVNVFVQLSLVAYRSPWHGTDEPPIGVQWAGTYNIEITNQVYKQQNIFALFEDISHRRLNIKTINIIHVT